MSDELIQRLRQLELRITAGANEACGSAADRIEQLQRKLAEVREALAGVMPYLETMLIDDEPDDATVGWEWDYEAETHSKPIDLTMGQIRRARAALAKIESKP